MQVFLKSVKYLVHSGKPLHMLSVGKVNFPYVYKLHWFHEYCNLDSSKTTKQSATNNENQTYRSL